MAEAVVSIDRLTSQAARVAQQLAEVSGRLVHLERLFNDLVSRSECASGWRSWAEELAAVRATGALSARGHSGAPNFGCKNVAHGTTF